MALPVAQADRPECSYPAAMLTVVIDRDSVAAGDDVRCHIARWEFPDDANLGDLLVRILDSGYLASVAGDVAWCLEAGGLELGTAADGESLRSKDDGRPETGVEIFAPDGGEIHVAMLSWGGVDRSLASLEVARIDDLLVFNLRYLAGNRMVPWSLLRERILATRR